MTAYIFPGQGAQFEGMGKDLHDSSNFAKSFFAKANEIIGFDIAEIMFSGSADDLKQTKVTQPAIFLHSILTYRLKATDAQPDAVAGHSLGEISALVAIGALTLESGLRLVSKRALAMQRACELTPSTMAAVLGMDDDEVTRICAETQTQTGEIVVAANYNCPGQLVISGSQSGVEAAIERLTAAGCKRALLLPVGGAFHSPLMLPAQQELAEAIEATSFYVPSCPIYQNVDAQAYTEPSLIKQNLITQLTAPVRWTQTVQNMLAKGITDFVEVGGTGKVLQGMIKKIDRNTNTLTL